MARPVKNNCEYFSHDTEMRNHRKVKAIRTKFGVTGYAVWSMFLEYLTGADGNVFENSAIEKELLSGDFGVSATEISDVLNYCLIIELLFENKGFIYSESLNKRLEPVYAKRGRAKELSEKQLRANGKFVTETPIATVVSVTETPQSKVKESKVKEIKENNSIIPETSSGFLKNPVLFEKEKTASTEIINAKPKKEKKVVADQNLKSSLRDIFNEFYIDRFKTKYIWAAKDHTAVSGLIANIKIKIRDEMPELEGDEIENQIIASFTHYIKGITDPWLLSNYALPLLNQRFNIIYQQIKNPNQHDTAKSRREQAVASTTKFLERVNHSPTGDSEDF